MEGISAQDVLIRLSQALGTKGDSELAASLGVAKQTISTWKKRDKVPLEQVVETSLAHDLSVDAILFGDKFSASNQPTKNNIHERMAAITDIRLAESVLDQLDEELLLTDRGLNAETLSEIFMAMGAVKRLLNGALFDIEKHKSELEDGINYFLSMHYEMMHLANRNIEKSKKESKRNVKQEIQGNNHTIAGNDITIHKK